MILHGVGMETTGFDIHCESFYRNNINYSPEEEQQFGMVCTGVGHTKTRPYSLFPPHAAANSVEYRNSVNGRILSEFQISYYTFGEGVFETETSKYITKPGSMHIMMPGVWHRGHHAFEVGWHDYWVVFKGNYFSRLVDEGILSEDSVFFDANPSSNIVSIYHHIFNEVIAQGPMYQLKVCSGILSLVAELLKRKQERPDQSDHLRQVVEKAKGLMDINIYDDIDLSHIAGDLGISLPLFYKIFKTYTSFTPYQYYINTKITVAKTLLEDNMAVKDTAYQLGFEDQYYFSRLFKNKTGISPKNWKKRVMEE